MMVMVSPRLFKRLLSSRGYIDDQLVVCWWWKPGTLTAAEEKGAELKAIEATKTTDRREQVILVVYKW